MLEPYALQLYREFLNGKSVAELAGESGIPVDRIESRLRAAALRLIAWPQRHSCEGKVRIRIVRL
ncbi:MAG: hypothetical protein LAQ30_01920 [Acidobacteriia bacterium]|nr:hypothetical protein [Terriglobia bacterium]